MKHYFTWIARCGSCSHQVYDKDTEWTCNNPESANYKKPIPKESNCGWFHPINALLADCVETR